MCVCVPLCVCVIVCVRFLRIKKKSDKITAVYHVNVTVLSFLTMIIKGAFTTLCVTGLKEQGSPVAYFSICSDT